MNISVILDFLSALKDNNSRDWFEAHKPWAREARDVFMEIVAFLINGIAVFDPTVQSAAPKDCIFRLNRDIRFSADKSPYKIHFGAYIAGGGRKSPNAGYYIHLQPGNESMLGGGIYLPEPETLKKIRQEVDYNPEELKKIVSDQRFSEYFGAVQGEKLKTAPKGYPPDHPNIEFLKLKSFFVIHPVSDASALSAGFLEKSLEVFETMAPFNEYLNVAIS